MKPPSLIFTLILSVFLTSCVGTIQTYEGPELPPEKVALVQVTPNPHVRYLMNLTIARIVAVDDARDDLTLKNVAVLPGEHAIMIRLERCNPLWCTYKRKSVTLDAEAGHIYIVNGKIIDYDNYFAWIVDKETGLIVAGAKPD